MITVLPQLLHQHQIQLQHHCQIYSKLLVTMENRLRSFLWVNARAIATMTVNVRLVYIALIEITMTLSLAVKGTSLEDMITVLPQLLHQHQIQLQHHCQIYSKLLVTMENRLRSFLWVNARAIATMTVNVRLVYIALIEVTMTLSLAVK